MLTTPPHIHFYQQLQIQPSHSPSHCAKSDQLKPSASAVSNMYARGKSSGCGLLLPDIGEIPWVRVEAARFLHQFKGTCVGGYGYCFVLWCQTQSSWCLNYEGGVVVPGVRLVPYYHMWRTLAMFAVHYKPWTCVFLQDGTVRSRDDSEFLYVCACVPIVRRDVRIHCLSTMWWAIQAIGIGSGLGRCKTTRQ